MTSQTTAMTLSCTSGPRMQLALVADVIGARGARRRLWSALGEAANIFRACANHDGRCFMLRRLESNDITMLPDMARVISLQSRP